MDLQKVLVNMTRDEIVELIKDLESGTMLILEMPDMSGEENRVREKEGEDINDRTI